MRRFLLILGTTAVAIFTLRFLRKRRHRPSAMAASGKVETLSPSEPIHSEGSSVLQSSPLVVESSLAQIPNSGTEEDVGVPSLVLAAEKDEPLEPSTTIPVNPAQETSTGTALTLAATANTAEEPAQVDQSIDGTDVTPVGIGQTTNSHEPQAVLPLSMDEDPQTVMPAQGEVATPEQPPMQSTEILGTPQERPESMPATHPKDDTEPLTGALAEDRKSDQRTQEQTPAPIAPSAIRKTETTLVNSTLDAEAVRNVLEADGDTGTTAGNEPLLPTEEFRTNLATPALTEITPFPAFPTEQYEEEDDRQSGDLAIAGRPEKKPVEGGTISTYRPSAGRSFTTKKRTSPRVLAHPLRIFVRALFEKDGFLRITLLPRRTPSMPTQITVNNAGKQVELNGFGANWYSDIAPKELPRILQEGTTINGTTTKFRWILTRRDIYVLSSLQGMTGYISGPRLVLGKKHIVLCTTDRVNEVIALISATKAPTPRILESTDGVPPGWVAVADVVPTEPFAFVKGAGILNILRPSLRIEIALEEGIRLERTTWLHGYPPSVHVYGDTKTSLVEIDGETARQEADGRFTANSGENLGTHLVTCAGVSQSYEISEGMTDWASWNAHRVGTRESNEPTFVCGGLIQGLIPSEPVAASTDSVEWCLQEVNNITPWGHETLQISTADIEAPNLLLLRWPRNRWARDLSLNLNGQRTDLSPAPRAEQLSLPLQRLATRKVKEGELVLESRFGTFTVAIVRTAWSITQLQCLEELDGNALLLRLTWTETGVASNRTVLLYHEHSTPLFSTALIPGQTALTARFKINLLPPGQYTVEIVGDDLATGNAKRRSHPIIVNILGIDDLLRHGRLRLHSVQTGDETHELSEVHYEIQVSGRITTGQVPADLDLTHSVIKSINEGWYVGTLSVREAERDVTKDYFDNPVKFEFDNEQHEITAIEDNTGDGAIFCPSCKRLFWTRSMEKAERRQRHRKLLTTDFRVTITTRDETKVYPGRADDRIVP